MIDRFDERAAMAERNIALTFAEDRTTAATSGASTTATTSPSNCPANRFGFAFAKSNAYSDRRSDDLDAGVLFRVLFIDLPLTRGCHSGPDDSNSRNPFRKAYDQQTLFRGVADDKFSTFGDRMVRIVHDLRQRIREDRLRFWILFVRLAVWITCGAQRRQVHPRVS